MSGAERQESGEKAEGSTKMAPLLCCTCGKIEMQYCNNATFANHHEVKKLFMIMLSNLLASDSECGTELQHTGIEIGSMLQAL